MNQSHVLGSFHSLNNFSLEKCFSDNSKTINLLIDEFRVGQRFQTTFQKFRMRATCVTLTDESIREAQFKEYYIPKILCVYYKYIQISYIL